MRATRKRIAVNACKMLIVVPAFAFTVHGASLSTLNQLASHGTIHETAPSIAHVEIKIAASSAKVWALLVNAPEWPQWQKQITDVSAAELLTKGANLTWKADGTIRSQVQLFEPQRRLAWTGAMYIAKAVHVWELVPQPDGDTLVKISESLDGPLIAMLYPSKKLADGDFEWLLSLKKAAEQ